MGRKKLTTNHEEELDLSKEPKTKKTKGPVLDFDSDYDGEVTEILRKSKEKKENCPIVTIKASISNCTMDDSSALTREVLEHLRDLNMYSDFKTKISVSVTPL